MVVKKKYRYEPVTPLEIRFICAGQLIEYCPSDSIVRGQPEPEKVIQSKVYIVNPKGRRLITLENGTCLTMVDMVRRVENNMHSGTQWGEVQSYHLEKSSAVEMAKRTERRNEKIDR